MRSYPFGPTALLDLEVGARGSLAEEPVVTVRGQGGGGGVGVRVRVEWGRGASAVGGVRGVPSTAPITSKVIVVRV